MSKKKNYNQEKNPLQMVLYTGIVLALLVFLFVLVFQNKNKQAAFEEKIKEMTARETEMVMTERKPREETKSETEAVTAGSTNVTAQTEQTMNTPTEREQSGLMSAEVNILVLNGSERPGVAGIWKIHLEESGYTNVYTATYTEALEQTLIYTDDAALGEMLKTEFTNAVVHPGKVESGIEMTEGETLPETIDAYIIIGRNNVTVSG